LPLLSKDRTREWLVDAIDLSRQKNPFDLWAWVIMPEHVHLVLLPRASVRNAAILTTLKQSVAQRAINWLKTFSPDYLGQLLDRQPNGKQCYRFWQRGGGYDRNLRSTREIHEKILYVHQNPVKCGLVARAECWPWSSAMSWKAGVDQPLAIDRQSVPTLLLLDDHVGSKLLE
jgi:putative transposase